MSASTQQMTSPWQACRLFHRPSPLPDPGPSPGRTSRSRKTLAPSAWAMAAVSSAEQASRSEEHTSELQSHSDIVCRLPLEKKKQNPHSSRPYKQKRKSDKVIPPTSI